ERRAFSAPGGDFSGWHGAWRHAAVGNHCGPVGLQLRTDVSRARLPPAAQAAPQAGAAAAESRMAAVAQRAGAGHLGAVSPVGAGIGRAVESLPHLGAARVGFVVDRSRGLVLGLAVPLAG